MKGLHKIAWILLIVGGLNWLLEAFGWGIGNWIPEGVEMIIYILVGLSALYEVFNHKSVCKECGTGGSSMPQGQM